MSTPAETSGTPSPLSDWLEEDLAEIEAYGCPCSCKAPEGTGTRHGYTCPWHRAMQSLRRGVARLTAERNEAIDACADWQMLAEEAERLGDAAEAEFRQLTGYCEAVEARAERYQMALRIIANTACSPECSCCEMDSDRARRALTEGGEDA